MLGPQATAIQIAFAIAFMIGGPSVVLRATKNLGFLTRFWIACITAILLFVTVVQPIPQP